jgi:ubiquinone/menaquinone biosynthesis C-methylase UbiE
MSMKETTLTADPQKYWQKFCGIELFKVKYHFQRLLYNFLRIKLPKLADQRQYWKRRGTVYMDEILASGYLDREIFFQDALIDALKQLDFNSFFEAGCGFGWNIRRVGEEFPSVKVGGLDFSFSQLTSSHRYLAGHDIPVVNGDNCCIPLRDKAFDVGFSLGVFMNIHPFKIEAALREMARVCGKYIIHIEYDENHTTRELREKRAFKTNIVSHDYKKMYEDMGMKVIKFATYKDFGKAYHAHQKRVASNLNRWEGFEGPEKYIFIIVQVC